MNILDQDVLQPNQKYLISKIVAKIKRRVVLNQCMVRKRNVLLK